MDMLFLTSNVFYGRMYICSNNITFDFTED